MKERFFWVLVAFYMTATTIAFTIAQGKKNYSRAQYDIQMYDLATDAQIEYALWFYGFDLYWHETPNQWDYIKSAFKAIGKDKHFKQPKYITEYNKHILEYTGYTVGQDTLYSVVYLAGKDTFALDYITEAQLESLMEFDLLLQE